MPPSRRLPPPGAAVRSKASQLSASKVTLCSCQSFAELGGSGWRATPAALKLCRFSGLGLRRLSGFYFDLLRLGFFTFGQSDLKHAIVELSLDVVRVDCWRQSEGSGKTAVAALDPVEVVLLFLMIHLAFTADGQDAVLQADVEIFLLDTRRFCGQNDVVLVLVDIDCRNEAAGCQSLFRTPEGAPEGCEGLVE